MMPTHSIDGHPVGIGKRHLALVREATVSDLPGIVTIHQKAFSNFFLTRLGREFLHRYYALVLDYPSGIVLVSEHRGILDGFACGFVEPPEFYSMMWRKKGIFVIPALSALMRDPSLAAGVMHAVRRIKTSASQRTGRSCEL